MRFASALTTKMVVAEAVRDYLARQVAAQLGPTKTDLAVMLVQPKFALQIDELVERCHKAVGARHLIGCTTGVHGVDPKVTRDPAFPFSWGNTGRRSCSLPSGREKPGGIRHGPDFWHFQLELEPDASPQFLMFVDPFTTHAVQLVDALTEAYPQAPIVGGLASGAQQGENRLFLDGKVYDEGVVGVGLTGKIVCRRSSRRAADQLANDSRAEIDGGLRARALIPNTAVPRHCRPDRA